MLQIRPQKIPVSPNEHGVLRVAGTRVSLDSVVNAFDNGETAEEIAQNFPKLDLKDIYVEINHDASVKGRLHEF